MPGLSAIMKIFSILVKPSEKWKLNFFRKALFQMKTRVCLKFFGTSPRNYEISSAASFCRRYLPVRRHFDGKNLVVYFL